MQLPVLFTSVIHNAAGCNHGISPRCFPTSYVTAWFWVFCMCTMQPAVECCWRLRIVQLAVPSGTGGRRKKTWSLPRRNRNASAKSARRTKRRPDACVRWRCTAPGRCRTSYASRRSRTNQLQNDDLSSFTWFSAFLTFFICYCDFHSVILRLSWIACNYMYFWDGERTPFFGSHFRCGGFFSK